MNVLVYFDAAAYTKLPKMVPLDSFSKGEGSAFTKGHNHRTLYSYDAAHVLAYLKAQGGKGNVTQGGIPKMGGYKDPKGFKITAPVIPIDIDTTLLEICALHAQAWCRWLDSVGATYYVQYTGNRGYHIDIPSPVIGYNPHEKFPDIVRVFARKMLELAQAFSPQSGIQHSFDAGIYARSHKIRVSGSKEGARLHKTLIPVGMLSSDLFRGVWCNYGRAVATEQRPSPDYDHAFTRSEVLHDLWQECRAIVDRGPLVEVLIPHSRPGQTDFRRRGIKNLDGLTARVAAGRGAVPTTSGDGGLVYQVLCPFHDDSRPSAAYFANSGNLFCHTCSKTYRPGDVAQKFGFALDWDEPVVVKTDATPLGETREVLMQDMRTSILDGTKIHVWQIPAGVGKSWAMRRISQERTDLIWSFKTQSHKLGGEYAQDLPPDTTHLREPWAHEPRCLTEPMVGGEMPYRSDEMKFKSGLSEDRLKVCNTCPLFRKNLAEGVEPCGYWLAKEAIKEPVTGVMAQHYVQFPAANEAINRHRDIEVLDENPMNHFVVVDVFHVHLLEPLLTSDQVRKTPFGEMMIKDLVRPIIIEGKMPSVRSEITSVYAPLLTQGTDTLGENGLDRRARETLDDIKDEDGFVGLQKLNVHPEANRFLNLLTAKNINDVRIVDDRDGKVLMVRSWNNPLDLPQQIHVLDASCSPHQRQMWENMGAQIHTYEVANERSRLIQDPSCSYSRSSKRRQLKEHDDRVTHTGYDRYAATLAYCKGLIEKHGVGEFGIISHKGCPYVGRLLKDVGIKPEDVKDHYWWFGNLRGLNSWGGKKAMIIIGDPSPHHLAYETEAFRSGQKKPYIDYAAEEYTTRHYRCRFAVPQARKDVCIFSGYFYCDEKDADGHQGGNHKPIMSWGSEYIQRLIQSEIYQAIARVRPLSHDVRITYLGVQDPGRRVYEQMSYSCDPRLLGAGYQSNVALVEEEERARMMVNHSMRSYTEIEKITGIDHDALAGMKSEGAIRDNCGHLITALLAQGYKKVEIADRLEISRMQVDRLIKKSKS